MNHSLKILFLVDDFPPVTYTSSGKVVFSFAKELGKGGHKVSVITSIQKKSQEGVENQEGIKVFRIYSEYHPRWRAWLSLYNPQTVSKVEKIIKEIQPDVVYFRHIHLYLSYHCFKIAKKYSKAVFLMANDVMLFSYEKVLPKNGNCIYKMTAWDHIKQARKRYNPFRGIIIRYYLKYIDKIFAISNALERALNVNGIKNVITIYNGIDVNEWEENRTETKKFKQKYNLEDKRVVFFGGRLYESKGGEVILRAMEKVASKVDNSVLLIIGEKNVYVETMIDIAKKLNIEDKLIFTGRLKGEELKAAYYGADVCTFPSVLLEAFGMIGLEAMACKKPVVGSCFGGIPEMVVDNKTGYIIDPTNTDLMAEKIIDLLKNPQKAKKFGEAGYKRARTSFSLEKQTSELLKQYYNFC